MPQSLSNIEIINHALLASLQKPIGSLSENNERAKIPQMYYDAMRRELLRACNWTFAKKELTLNLIGESTGDLDPSIATTSVTSMNTVQPYLFMYQYPPQCLFILKLYTNILTAGFDFNAMEPEDNNWWGSRYVHSEKNRYEIVRSPSTNELAIATNLQNAMCRYTSDITDCSQFDPIFASALSLKIAQKICIPLGGDKELKAQIDKDLEITMTDAYRLNLSENPDHGPMHSSFERHRGSW